MRIAIGGIVHETNTYATQSFGPTGLDSFRIARGEAIYRSENTRTYLGGMIKACRDQGYEMVPVIHASAQPSGTIDAETYRSMKTELVEGIAGVLPVDAVVLDTHGAGVVVDIDDLEADLGAAIRLVIGPDIPLVTTLDLHGSITEEMNEVFDLMLGVYDYPHVDMFERGIEAIEAVPRLVSGEWQPTTHVERLPMLTPTSTTDVSPAKDIRQRCLDLEGEPGVLRCAFFHGFPFTDIPATGASVVVTTNGDQGLARQTAQRIAAEVWERREEFVQESLSAEIAINQAIRLADQASAPVVINDTADNCGGGSPGDATHVLRALIEANPAGLACFGFIYDPAVADQAHQAGAGAIIEVALGGKHDDIHGEPIKCSAYVKTTSDGRFIYSSPMLAGAKANYGSMARLQIGGQNGLDVLVGSARSQVFDREVFALHGIDVSEYDLVVLKSSQHFRAGFSDLAADIITADSAGLTTLRVENFDHPRADGPRWPIDPETVWSAD
ncbi:MAG: M81 family metallopeptidase [Acidimicrobiales bacterium]